MTKKRLRINRGTSVPTTGTTRRRASTPRAPRAPAAPRAPRAASPAPAAPPPSLPDPIYDWGHLVQHAIAPRLEREGFIIDEAVWSASPSLLAVNLAQFRMRRPWGFVFSRWSHGRLPSPSAGDFHLHWSLAHLEAMRRAYGRTHVYDAIATDVVRVLREHGWRAP